MTHVYESVTREKKSVRALFALTGVCITQIDFSEKK